MMDTFNAAIELTKEHIVVEQAFVDGKEIQANNKTTLGLSWSDADCPGWDWKTYEFRVKRVPREVWRNHYRDDMKATHETRQEADSRADKESRLECVHYREVMEDE